MNNPYGCNTTKNLGRPWMPKIKPRYSIHHVIILDKSQSMNAIRHATIDGFNAEIESIRNIRDSALGKDYEHKATITIFSSDVDYMSFNMNPDHLAPLSWKTYVPAGRTALNDAIGTTIDRIQKDCYYDLLNKGSKVNVTIITDGRENNSRVYTTGMIRDWIERLQRTNQWTFVYASTNADTEEIADAYAIPLSNTYKFDQSPEGATKAFNAISEARLRYSNSVSSNPDAIVSEGFFKKA